MTDMLLNRGKYNFDDFTLINYQRLMCLAIEKGYLFSDYSTGNLSVTREIVWRHDVEFSVHRALKMAKIEYDLGLKAHYYIQLHSEFYNTFEKEIYVMIKQIIELGHYIGLHFDAHFWEVKDISQLEECLSKDTEILEDLLGVRVNKFSFHNTSPELLEMNDLYYSGLLNVYAKEIRDKYRYCTDSTGIWRYERLEDVLKDDSIQYLQVLTHDGMWQDEPIAPRQRVLRCINGRAEKLSMIYDQHLLMLDQENVDEHDI